ncbi:hypothetical protein HanIR_Chr10g0501031 [Helianthus annuus]|nr:hypothetical protein HanIR_Chr10g0501031 [Helianthus annuus]
MNCRNQVLLLSLNKFRIIQPSLESISLKTGGGFSIITYNAALEHICLSSYLNLYSSSLSISLSIDNCFWFHWRERNNNYFQWRRVLLRQ